MARGHDPRIHETPDASDIRNPDITHEESDVNTRGIAWFVLFLAVLIVVALLLLRGMFNLFESWAREAEGERPPMARTAEERLPPEPRLQAAPGFQAEGRNLELKEPQAEWRVVHQKWQEELNSYGVVDRDQGVARIPINEAIKIIAQKGIQPVNQNSSQQQRAGGQTPNSNANTQQQQPSESSSGRQMEKKQ